MLKKFIKNHSFGLMITTSMSAIMLSTNMFMMEGFTLEALRRIGLFYIPIVVTAFLISTYIVGPMAKTIIPKLVKKETKKLVKILAMTSLMVTGMVSMMSLVVTVVTGTHGGDIFETWLVNVSRNFPIALSVQLLIVGPAVRHIHSSLIPRPTLQEAAPNPAS